jgi:tripartite-type tricarboxylate transporter receptor subunit TctC
MRRRRFVTDLGPTLLMLLFATSAALADSGYPSHPIRLIMGYPAGTMADISTRVLTNYMSQSPGQQIVIENKPGAGSNLAAETTARAPNDGYTHLSAELLVERTGIKLQHVPHQGSPRWGVVAMAAGLRK